MAAYDEKVFAEGGLGSISGSVATLPVGANLGEERWDNGIKYRLCHNASTAEAIDTGQVCVRYVGSSVIGQGGPYFVTPTATTESVVGLVCAVHHKTVPTSYYFWGAVEGHPIPLRSATQSIATGMYVCPNATGTVTQTATVSHAMALNLGDAASATATTGTASGRFHIMFEGGLPYNVPS